MTVKEFINHLENMIERWSIKGEDKLYAAVLKLFYWMGLVIIFILFVSAFVHILLELASR